MSEIVRDFDSNYEGSDPLEGVIIDLIESIHVSTPETRWTTDEAVFTVAERSLTASVNLPQDVRHFNAVRDVNSFLSLASVGLPSSGKADNTDLLPISHPASTAPTALSASALREVRAVWIASDPRITDENVRSIVASVYSSNPTSIEFTYHLTRMQMLSLEELPADIHLMPIVAFGNPFAGKNASVFRAARAKAQRRDRFGRFAYMGGGIRFYAKKRNGQIVSIVGKVAGNSKDANGIDVEIKDIPGFKNGIYTVPSNTTEMIEAVLPEHATSNIANVQQHSDVPYVDIAHMIPKALPDNWAPTKVAGQVSGLTPETATGHFVSGDGYEVNAYHNESDALKQRVEDAINRFGSQIVGPTGTDVLDPSQPVYEVISSKRGQNEVVGYAQDWASIQQLAAGEDEAHPGVENEPVAQLPKEPVVQEMAKKKKPENEQPEEEPAKEVAPEEVFPEEGEPGWDPSQNMPAGWNRINSFTKGKGPFYSFDGGKYIARFGTHPVATEATREIDPETGEVTWNINQDVVDNSLALYRGDDPNEKNRVALGTDWSYVEEARSADSESNGEPVISNAQSVSVVPPLVDADKYAKPNEKQIGGTRATEPLPAPTKHNGKIAKINGILYTLYKAAQYHTMPDPALVDTYDDFISHPEKYNYSQVQALLDSIKATPKYETPLTSSQYSYAMPEQREKVRRAIDLDNGEVILSDEQKEAYRDRYRGLNFQELSALLLEINNAKGLERTAGKNKAVSGTDTRREIKNPLTPKAIKDIKTATWMRDFSSTEEAADLLAFLDMVLAHPERYDYIHSGVKQAFSNANKLNSKQERDAWKWRNVSRTDYPSDVQRKQLRDLLGNKDGVSDVDISPEDLKKYDNLAIARMTKQDIENAVSDLKEKYPGIKPVSTFVSGEDDDARVESETALGSDLTEFAPSSAVIAQVQALIRTKDIPEDVLKDFMDNHRTLPGSRWKFFAGQFAKYPDKTQDQIAEERKEKEASKPEGITKAPAEPKQAVYVPKEEQAPKFDPERLKGAIKEAANMFYNRLTNTTKKYPPGERARAYLESRGFTLDDMKHFKMGLVPTSDSYDVVKKYLLEKGYTLDELIHLGLVTKDGKYDMFQGRIVWPIKDSNGVPIGFNGRALPDDIRENNPKFMNPTNSEIYSKSKNLYNLDLAKDSIKKTGQLIVVESATNAMALHKAGYDNVVSSSGLAFTPEHVKAIQDAVGVDGVKEVVIAYDPDGPGQAAAQKLIPTLAPFNADITSIKLTPGEDVADTYKKYGVEHLQNVIADREPVQGAPKPTPKATEAVTEEKPASYAGTGLPFYSPGFLDHYIDPEDHETAEFDGITQAFDELAKMGAPLSDLLQKLPFWFTQDLDDENLGPFMTNLVPTLNKYASLPGGDYNAEDYKKALESLKLHLSWMTKAIAKKHPELAESSDQLINHIDNILAPSLPYLEPDAEPETEKPQAEKPETEKKSKPQAEKPETEKKPETPAEEPESGTETPATEDIFPEDVGSGTPATEEPKEEEAKPETTEAKKATPKKKKEVKPVEETKQTVDARVAAIKSAAKNADAKLFRSNLVYTLAFLAATLNNPTTKMYPKILPLIKGAISDLTALQGKMRGRNKPSAADVNRELKLIRDGLTNTGSAHKYGDFPKTNKDMTNIVSVLGDAVKSLIGTYTEGETGPASNKTGFESFEQEMASFSRKPSMRRVTPPGFWGPAFDGLHDSSDWEDPRDYLAGQEFNILDIETTGLPDPETPNIKNDLIQVAVIKVRGLQQVEMFKTYINPESDLSPYTLKTVGDGMGGKVTKAFLNRQPKKKEALAKMLEFIGENPILAGHNLIHFDMEVINRAIRDAGLQELEPRGYIDTYGLSTHIMPRWSIENPDAPFKLLPNGDQYKSDRLEDLVTYFGLSNNGRHEADADVISTLEVLNKMLDRAVAGKSASGKAFSLTGTYNNYDEQDYQNALDEYHQSLLEYLAFRTSQAALFAGEIGSGDDSALINMLLGASDPANAVQTPDIVTNANLPAPAVLADVPSGTYVVNIRNRRVGKSYGSANGDKVLVEYPASDFLVSGKTVLELVNPDTIAAATEHFMSRNGILLDVGMGVSIPNEEGTWQVSSLFDLNKVIVSNLDKKLIVDPSDVSVVSNGGLSPASRQQENRIINNASDLEKLGLIDKVLSNAYQNAATNHYYSADSAKALISRLVKAKDQHMVVEANKDRRDSLPKAKRSPGTEIIQEMANEGPKKTVGSVDPTTLDKVKIAFQKLGLRYAPNAEGERILKAFMQGLNIRIKALAGSGKTTSMEMIAQMASILKPHSKLLYVVFNKENQLHAHEVFSKIGNTESRTSDSISFNTDINFPLREKQNLLYDISDTAVNAPINLAIPELAADFLGIGDDPESKRSRIATVAVVTDALNNWVQSDDEEVDFKHFKRYIRENEGKMPTDPKLIEYVQTLWADIVSPIDFESRQILVDFNHMFKHWALTNPDLTDVDDRGRSVHGLDQIPDGLLLDEAQDINPAFRKLIIDQHDLHHNGIQIVTVGDPNQAIYQFRGSEDALDFVPTDIDLGLTQSYRSGEPIVDITNRVIEAGGGTERLKPDPTKDSEVVEDGALVGEPNLMVIPRTNAGVLQAIDFLSPKYDDKPAIISEALKMDALKILKHLNWFSIQEWRFNNPDKAVGMQQPLDKKDQSPLLKGFVTMEQVKKAAAAGTLPHRVKMVMNALNAVKHNHDFDKISEAYDHLTKLLRRARVINDNFSVPAEIGKKGTLGGGISYRVENGVLTLYSNGNRPPRESVAWGLWSQHMAAEDNGFVRTDRPVLDDEGNPVISEKFGAQKEFEWDFNLGKKNIKKVLDNLVESFNGKDGAFKAYTAHTSKGLESDNVMLWNDKWGTPDDLEGSEEGNDEDASRDWRARDERNLHYVGLSRAKYKLDPGPLRFYMDRPMSELQAAIKEFNADNAVETPKGTQEIPEQEMAQKTTSKATEMIGHYEKLLQSLEEGEYIPATVKRLDPFDPLFAETKETLRDQERSKLIQQLSTYKELADMAKLEQQSEG
jgi:DNA primase catalytic core